MVLTDKHIGMEFNADKTRLRIFLKEGGKLALLLFKRDRAREVRRYAKRVKAAQTEGKKYYGHCPAHFDSDAAMYEILECLTYEPQDSTDLMWVRPEHCGDMTDAPMLGYYDNEQPMPEGIDKQYVYYIGEERRRDENGDDYGPYVPHYRPVLARWAWMGYMLESLQGELLEEGEVVLEGGTLDAESAADPEVASTINYLTCVPSIAPPAEVLEREAQRVRDQRAERLAVAA